MTKGFIYTVLGQRYEICIMFLLVMHKGQIVSPRWCFFYGRVPLSLAEPRLLTGRVGLVQRNTLSCSREMFDYVIRSKCVGVRAESLSMFSSEKRLRTDIKYFPTHNTIRITQTPTI